MQAPATASSASSISEAPRRPDAKLGVRLLNRTMRSSTSSRPRWRGWKRHSTWSTAFASAPASNGAHYEAAAPMERLKRGGMAGPKMALHAVARRRVTGSQVRAARPTREPDIEPTDAMRCD